jgi:hypothetical protein
VGMETTEALLKSTNDHYGGVLIDPEDLPHDLIMFGESLEASLATWSKQKKRGVWLKIPVSKAHLVSLALEALTHCFGIIERALTTSV